MLKSKPITPFRAVTVTAFITVCGALSGTAIAAQNSDTFSVKINKADLTTQTGLAAVYVKLEAAAQDACALNGYLTLTDKLAVQACVENNMAGFIQQIDSRRLHAYHDAYHARAGAKLT